MNATLDDNNYTSTSCKPFATTTTTSIHDNNDINQSMQDNSQYEETVALQQLKQNLDSTPSEMKSSLMHAQQVTDIINDDHLLGFLYAENFNVDLALKRLIRYWKRRHKVFGDDYILPLTLYGAMKNNEEFIRRGFLVLLPVPDDQDRLIIYGRPSLIDRQSNDDLVDEVIQVFWYLVHVAMEYPRARKNGYIFISNIKGMNLRNFHPKVALALARGDRDFPILRKGVHACYPNYVMKLVSSPVRAVLSLRERQIFTLHSGTSDRVLASLAKHSIPKTALPTDMGGELDVSLEAFVAARLTIEGEGVDSDISLDGNTSDVSKEQSGDGGGIDSFKFDPTLDPQVASISQPASPQIRAPEENCTAITKEPIKIKYKSHPGRHGDERMNKAVKARQKDPKISLMSALLAGGFIFPQLYSPGVKLSKVLDTEGVTVYQRKNQLNRRLREERNRKSKS